MKINSKQYARVLYTLLVNQSDAEVRETIKQFAKYFFENGETGKLSEIRRQYSELKLKKEGKLKAVVSTAMPTQEFIPKRIFEKEIEVENILDPKLQAGTRFTIGDTLIDNTIARRLRNLKNALS